MNVGPGCKNGTTLECCTHTHTHSERLSHIQVYVLILMHIKAITARLCVGQEEI